MKTTLTIEKSDKLIELGVDKRYAELEIKHYEDKPTEIKRVFTLTCLLSILPKEVDFHHLDIEASNDGYHVAYMLWDSCDEVYHYMGATERPELIDALYQLLIWVIENGHLNQKEQ